MERRTHKIPRELTNAAMAAARRKRGEALPSLDVWNVDELVLQDGGPPRVARALVTGFGLQGEALSVGPVTIRNPDAATDERLREYGQSYDRTCVLELRYRQRNDVMSVYAEPMRLLETAFVALQMTVDGWVGSSLAHHYDERGTEVGVSGGPRTATADSWHPGGDPLITADKTFAEDLRAAIWAQSSPLSNAIHRFSKGCSNLITDSIVDFAVVLDALLGYGIREEITHRVASRGAYLLASPSDDRFHRYIAIKYLYGCRSKFVHEAANDVLKPNGKERLAFQHFGVTWNDADDASMNRYYIAELARRTTRAVVWKFVRGEAHLDSDWLTRLELGLG